MHRIILVVAVVLGFAGCTYVNSAAGGNTGQTNCSWFTETTGLPGMPFSSRVYYCPPPGGGGAATCTEAEMVEGGTAAPSTAVPAAPAAPTPPPAPEGAPAGGDEGMEGIE